MLGRFLTTEPPEKPFNSSYFTDIMGLPRCLSGNFPISFHGASLVAQMVKNPLAVQETGVPSLSQEDPLEKGMATHSSILAWRIPWT